MAEQRPTVEWVDNVALEMEMKFDAPFKDGENEYGKWYLWTVEVDGEDHSMFAKQDLEYLLEAAEPQKGDVFQITRQKLPKTPIQWLVLKNGYQVSMTGDTPPSASESTPAPQEQKPPSKPQAQPRAVSSSTEPSYGELVGLMEDCVTSAVSVWTGGWAGRDSGAPANDVAGAIERLAVTLYLDCRKAGIWPDPTSGTTENPTDRQEGTSSETSGPDSDTTEPPEPPMPEEPPWDTEEENLPF